MTPPAYAIDHLVPRDLAAPGGGVWLVVVVVALGAGAVMLVAAVVAIAVADRQRAHEAAAIEQRIARLHDAVARATAHRRSWIVVDEYVVAHQVIDDVAVAVGLAAIDRALEIARRRELRPVFNPRSLDDRVH